MPDPLYTAENCKPAYQLRWSLALFATAELPSESSWLAPLSEAVEKDGIRILEFCFKPRNVNFFLVSTQPHVAPSQIVKSVKGRLQHCIRSTVPKAFQRNYWLTSVGDAKREVVEEYVSSQLGHHRMVDERAQQRLQEFQLSFPDVDLARPQCNAHARYVYNLHLVLIREGRSIDVSHEYLVTSREMFLRAARKKQHRVSRLSLCADHLHATLGCTNTESPEEVALSYMNNLAYAHGMKSVFSNGYYVGTFGEYDMEAIRP